MLLNRARGSNPLVPTDHGIKTPPDKKGEKSGGVLNVIGKIALEQCIIVLE